MIKVTGLDPGVVARRMRHHAEQYRPLIDALVYGLMFESSLAQDDKVHRLAQSKRGPGSFGLYLADGRQFHFRPHGGTQPWIEVRDSYMHGHTLTVLKTDAQARRFMRRLRPVAASQAA